MNYKKEIADFQLITHPLEGNSAFNQARKVLQGGCKWIQLRMKKYNRESILSEGKRIMELKQDYDFSFIINDNPEIALELGADGVHLGKKDMSPDKARTLLGEKFIIGGTANTIDDIERLVNEGVDYIGLGPYRFTTTKEKLSPVLGQDGYNKLMKLMCRKNIKVPVVGIGGILLEDINPLLQTGLHGIAVSSAITNTDSIVATTKTFIKNIQKAKSYDNYKTIKIRG